MSWVWKWLIKKEAKGMLKDLLQLKFLEGKRTQIAAVVLAVLTLFLNLNVITQEQYSGIVGFLISAGLLTAAAHQPK